MSIECHYESRRKRRTATGLIGTLSSITDNGNVESSGSDQERGKDTNKETTNQHDTQGRKESRNNNRDERSVESATGELDEWMDMDTFLLNTSSAAQLSGISGDDRKESALPDLSRFNGV
jgi:hypothetical protein